MTQEIDSHTLYILKCLREDIKSLDEKWELQLIEIGSQKQAINALTTQVNKLTQTVHTGNGEPSLTVQVSALKAILHDLKDFHKEHNLKLNKRLNELSKDLSLLKAKVGIKTPDIKIEKWKTAGKVAGIITLTLPGILSWLHG